MIVLRVAVLLVCVLIGCAQTPAADAGVAVGLVLSELDDSEETTEWIRWCREHHELDVTVGGVHDVVDRAIVLEKKD